MAQIGGKKGFKRRGILSELQVLVLASLEYHGSLERTEVHMKSASFIKKSVSENIWRLRWAGAGLYCDGKATR